MKLYVQDDSLVVFDVTPPREYVGAKAYRADWEGLFAMFQGPVKFELSDLHVFANGTTGYGYSIQHLSGTDTKGQPIDLTVRVTDGYRKVKGRWLIAHEHVSVPVDLTTGKPDLASKP
jgi:ketosteroid isomerase-like protein